MKEFHFVTSMIDSIGHKPRFHACVAFGLYAISCTLLCMAFLLLPLFSPVVAVMVFDVCIALFNYSLIPLMFYPTVFAVALCVDIICMGFGPLYLYCKSKFETREAANIEFSDDAQRGVSSEQASSPTPLAAPSAAPLAATSAYARFSDIRT